MKTLRFLSLLSVAGLILFTSCNKKMLPPQLEAIPNNAMFVLGMENKQLIEKGDLKNYKEYHFLAQACEEMKSENSLVANFVNQLIENPKLSGLDLDRSYCFGVKEGSSFYLAAVFKMDNMTTFENNIQAVFQFQDIEASEIVDKGAYKIIQPAELACAWNKNLLFLILNNDVAINYDELFAMPKEKSITSVADFIEFQNKPYDIGFWMPYKAVLDYSEVLGLTEYPAVAKEWEHAYAHAYLNFEQGEVNLSGGISPKAEADKFYAKYPIIKKDFDKSILSAFPATSYLAMKLSFNIQGYMTLVQDMMKQMDDEYHWGYEEILKDSTVNTVVNGLNGDMLLSLYGFAQGPLPIPLAGFCFTVNSDEDFNRLIALAPEGTIQPEGDHHVINLGFIKFYLAYKDKKVYVTNDTESLAAFTGTGYSNSLANGTLGNTLQTSPFLYYINLDVEEYPENIKTLAKSETEEVLTYLQPYKDITFQMIDDYTGVISLKFKDKSQNSLKQLLKSIDELAAAK